MKLIVGLGNPGRQYEQNRHNIGFMVVDALAHDQGVSFKLWGQGRKAELAQVTLDSKTSTEKNLLFKPLTFMNLSGQAVVQAAGFYKIIPQDILVIHDDLDIPFGDVRLKNGGGDGGHNGLKSVSQALSSSDYFRIRMGIGRPHQHSDDSSRPRSTDAADYVLQNFTKNEGDTVDQMIDKAIEAIRAFVAEMETFNRLMNNFNQRKQEQN